MSICSGSIPERMNCTEGIIWIYALSKMGLVNLDADEIVIEEYDHGNKPLL
jgi:hypothetical protein